MKKNLKIPTTESNKRHIPPLILDMNVQVLDIQTVRVRITGNILLFHELGSFFLGGIERQNNSYLHHLDGWIMVC